MINLEINTILNSNIQTSLIIINDDQDHNFEL